MALLHCSVLLTKEQFSKNMFVLLKNKIQLFQILSRAQKGIFKGAPGKVWVSQMVSTSQRFALGVGYG